MIYFCADDYGISEKSNDRIEKCVRDGALNKVSVLPNGENADLVKRLENIDAEISLHINLVEGHPLSKAEDVGHLIGSDGCFRYSFIGLFLLLLSTKRKRIEEEIYREIDTQLKFWRKTVGEDVPILMDSHQHTHMIPFIFKVLMRVIEDNKIDVKYLRFTEEPITPYLLEPSLYFEYSIVGIIKQWLLKLCSIVNRKELRKADIKPTYFMGAMFSGKLSGKRVKKLLPHYQKLAEKNGRDIEIAFHPGYSEIGEQMMKGTRKGFQKFYLSPWRKKEYEALLSIEN